MLLKELEYLYHKIPDYQITPFLSIKHPTYKEIVEYGEEKYISKLYNLCVMPDDFKSELFDIGYNWHEVDDLVWFYTMFIQPSEDLSIIFTSDIRHYDVYENKETGEIVLYNSMLDEFLTRNNVKLIREHLNSMIGWSYKSHREIPTNNRTRDILIEDDQERKRINSKKERSTISVKDIILKVLYDKYFENNIETIKKRCYVTDNTYIEIANVVDSSYQCGEFDIINKLAEDLYKELKERL